MVSMFRYTGCNGHIHTNTYTNTPVPPHPQSDYVMSLSGGGRQYSVYVHSYLGFGLMAGRAAVLQLDTAKDAHPCVPKEHAGVCGVCEGLKDV